MSLLVFLHAAVETPAALGRALVRDGHRLRYVELFAGQPVPPDLDDVEGVLAMGGPMNVEDAPQYPWIPQELALLRRAHEAGIPIVGVCLGAQLIAAALGGQVAAMGAGPEIGWHPVKQTFPGTTDPLLAGIPWNSIQFHAHGQEVSKLPADSVLLASSRQCKVQAYRVGLTTYGFQYHFEWSRAEIEAIVRSPWVTQFGQPEAIRTGFESDYDEYRRLGARLCDNVAAYLLPVEKRGGRQRQRRDEKIEAMLRNTQVSQA